MKLHFTLAGPHASDRAFGWQIGWMADIRASGGTSAYTFAAPMISRPPTIGMNLFIHKTSPNHPSRWSTSPSNLTRASTPVTPSCHVIDAQRGGVIHLDSWFFGWGKTRGQNARQCVVIRKICNTMPGIVLIGVFSSIFSARRMFFYTLKLMGVSLPV